MKYYSLNQSKSAANTSFEQAVIQGIAPDKGLYFPNEIKPLDPNFIQNIERYSNQEIAFEVIHQFVNGEIPDEELKKIIDDTLCFNFPTIAVEEHTSELQSRENLVCRLLLEKKNE